MTSAEVRSITRASHSHYEVRALLSSGGMGVVYRASDTRCTATGSLRSWPRGGLGKLLDWLDRDFGEVE